MPPMTAVQIFIDAIRTGKTRTMLAFDSLFTPPYEAQPWLQDIKVAEVFDNTLPPWAVVALAQKGLSGREIAHINIWPNNLKEQIRGVVEQAIDAGRSVRFFWGLWDGTAPTIETDTSGDPLIVKFLTPRSAVTMAGTNVDVGIYPPPSP